MAMVCEETYRKAYRKRSIRSLVARVLELGVQRGLPIGDAKRLRLCNIFAFGGSLIMATWAVVEAVMGDQGNLLWELRFVAGFVAVLGLSAMGFHRLARFGLVMTANICVFAGAVLFKDSSGGFLPLFAMAAVPLLLFGPEEWLLATLGAALPAIFLTISKTGLAAHLFSIHPRPAPHWYFAANAATTFVLAFLVPFFFFRLNVRAEASLQRTGQWKLKRLIDADLIGVVRGRLSGCVTGCIEDANDTFLSMLGYTRQDVAAGTLDLGIIAPTGSPLTDLPQRGPTSVYELVCRRKDGTTVPALVGVARLDDSDDSNDEVVGFVLDLTAQKHLEAQRAMLHDSREELRLRDLFNSIASHELKTPLTALLLNLRLLSARMEKETAPTSPLRAQVVRCETAAARMAGLIHALLDVAQVHRGQLTLDVRETDVVDAVRSVVSGFDVNRNDPGSPIALRTEEHFTAQLDPLRFDQVITNLLSNAVKYGGGKPIEVRLSHDLAADAAHLEVIDDGPGIDPGMTQKIFEPFQRATSMKPIPGMGLGLYVVKMIVEGHGGRVAVHTELGHGSRFIVDLPCALPVRQPQQQPQ